MATMTLSKKETELETQSLHAMKNFQLDLIREEVKDLPARSPFYAEKYKGINLNIQTYQDFLQLPFLEKEDLRDAYPLGLAAVPEDQIVRIHSSSGTTGTPVIIPYTQKDVDDWALLFSRCYEIAGVTKTDRVHITPGYGLWTAGIGFQAGAELLGAMTIPMGPGNTEKQLRMMQDMKSTVLCATSSYALLLAEAITREGIKDKIHLERGLIGSERWSEKMRANIAGQLGIQLYDIYGLTEIYGPGIGISCDENAGMHYFDDYLYFEVIDPVTLEVLPEGELGELVITTLRKEGAPLIRYRTHDLTRLIPGTCACGRSYPRISTLLGRTDDMIKVKGVNVFPAAIEEVICETDHATGEYQLMIDHLCGKDVATLFFETDVCVEDRFIIENILKHKFRSKIGFSIKPRAVGLNDLPRSEKKANRIFDNRY